MDDATSAIYSALLVKEESTASTFRALEEVFGRHGLPPLIVPAVSGRLLNCRRKERLGALDKMI